MKLATLVLTAALAVSTLAAQPGPPPPGERGPKFDAIKSYLGLSDEQLQQFQTLRQSFHEAVRTIMQDTRAKRQQLRDEMAKESPNPTIVGDLTVQIQQARKQIGDKHKQFSEQARNVLTGDQQAKLAALEQARALLPAIREAQGLQLLEGDGPGGPGFGPGPGIGPGVGPGPRGPRPAGQNFRMGFGRGGARG